MSTNTELPYPAITSDPAKPLVDPAQPIAAAARQITYGAGNLQDALDAAAINAVVNLALQTNQLLTTQQLLVPFIAFS